MKEFVVDHIRQRLRCIEACSSDELTEEVERVEQQWADETKDWHESDWHVGPITTKRLKREELRKTLVFPNLPNPSRQQYYESVFPSSQEFEKLVQKLHLDDYSNFCSSLGNTEKHRILNHLPDDSLTLYPGLPKASSYPVPEPSFPDFPKKIISLEPRQPPDPPKKYRPKWYQYLLFWDLLSEYSEYNRAVDQQKQQKHAIELFNSWLSELQTDRMLYLEERKKEFEKRVQDIKGQWEQARLMWETSASADITRYKELRSDYESGESAKVSQYFRTQLECIPLLPCCDRRYGIEFDEEAGILLIDCKLPDMTNLEIIKTKNLVSGSKRVPASQKETREVMNQLPFLMVMRIIWEVPQVDYQHKVGLIACNGYVVYDDPATGKVRQDVILSIVAKREELEEIRLEKVNPEASFRALKGVAAARISELVPVQPLIQFNKQDSRFIAAREIIDSLGDKNLATMDWQDFEHLIRELFEKEFGQAGTEVRVTQASRDRGVDAIAFDPDPLRGGKFVIQAKRYTNTVDVSAVRDLYGTVVNEGANRGILVTTSNYGRDAYEFAKDKPITLINGANLLHLLEKHGYNMRIDLKEAKRLMNEGS